MALPHDFIGAPATQGNSKITAHPALGQDEQPRRPWIRHKFGTSVINVLIGRDNPRDSWARGTTPRSAAARWHLCVPKTSSNTL